MNFKKILSGISAVAIAFGSFAGLAITAGASGVREIDFIGSSSAVETFDSYTNNGWSTSPSLTWANPASGNNHFGIASFTYVAGPAVGDSVTDTTDWTDYPTYVDGNALDFQGRSANDNKINARITYTLPTVAAQGKLYFSSSFLGHFGDNNPYAFTMTFYDSDGAAVANIHQDNSASTCHMRFCSGSNTGSAGQVDRTDSNMAFRGRKKTAFDLGFIFDIDNNKVTLSADYITGSFVRSTDVYSGTARPLDIKDIASIGFTFTTNTRNITYGWAFDNMKLYQQIDEYSVSASDTASATVSVDKNAAIAGETVTVTAAPKSGYRDAAITVTGDTSGDTISVNSDGEFTMPAEDVTVTVTAREMNAADAIIVSYRTDVSDASTEVQTKTIDLTSAGLYADASYNYYVGAGIVGTDGNLYRTSSNNFRRTATLVAGTTTVAESVELYATSGNFVFNDWDSMDPYAYPQSYSNGKVSSSNGNPYVTVTKTGYYDITVHAGQGASRQTTVVKGDYVDNETNVIIATFNTSNGGTYKTANTVYLEANDKVTVHGSASTAYIDYVLLKRISRDVTIGETGNGTITPSATITRSGATITLTATPDSGYAFTHIYYNGTEIIPNEGVYSFTMPDEDVTITATTGEAESLSSLTVNCVAEVSGVSTTIMTETPSVTGIRTGDIYTYSPYAYVLYNGAYYKYDGVVSSNGRVPQVSRRATSVNEVMTVPYTLAADVVYYTEVNAQTNTDSSHSNIAPAANTNASGGMDGGYVYGESGSTHYCYHTFTVPEDGTYRITGNTVGTYDDSSKGCTVVVDLQYLNESLGQIISTNGAPAKASAELDLKAGSHTIYFVTLGDYGCKLDYFVVEEVASKANLYNLSKQYKNCSFVFGKVSVASGENVIFTPTPDEGYGDELVVTLTNKSSNQTSVLTPNNGVYGFRMPSADVEVRAFATYDIPVEVDYDISEEFGYRKANPTDGDGKYARGFTFTAYHGWRTITGVSVQIPGKTADNKGGNNNNVGDTSSSGTMNISGDAIFGIVIWTEENVEALKAFDPENIIISVDIG